MTNRVCFIKTFSDGMKLIEMRVDKYCTNQFIQVFGFNYANKSSAC